MGCLCSKLAEPTDADTSQRGKGTPNRHTRPEATPLGSQKAPQFALSEHILSDLAHRLGREWTRLARELHFKLCEVERIKEDHSSTDDRIVKMLITWWQGWKPDDEGGNDLDALCRALEKINRADLAAELKGLKCNEGVECLDLEQCRNEFIGYYRGAMCMVPMLPWFPSEVSDIYDIYVELNLMEKENTVPRVVPRPIRSYEDMLRLQLRDGLPVTFILVSGIAGSGKTTIVSKMAHDWTLDKPESPLSKFRLFVALSMRELKGASDLIEAIFDQILPKDTKLSRASLRVYLTSHATEVLVVLDGADEFDKEGSKLPTEGDVIDIIRNKILRGCTVIVTTRPHMVDKLFRLNPSFTRIESNGFSDSGVQEYIQKFFKDQEISSKLYQTIRASKSLQTLARIPMMLMLTCLVWSGGHNKLPETLTELFRRALVFILERQSQKADELYTGLQESDENELKEMVQGLGKPALIGLMCPEQQLVFETAEFDTPKLVDKACRIGILSQERVRSKSRMVQTVTFLHKTVQEAIAGFYWASLIESDSDAFGQYLIGVTEENAFSLEYLLRFCCGANVKAATALLAHIADTFTWNGAKEWELVDYKNFSLEELKSQLLLEPEKGRLTKRLWLLMHLEAQSKGLNALAESVFRDYLTFSFNCPEDEWLAFVFLIKCATNLSSGPSFLAEIRNVCICGIHNDNSADQVVNLLRHSPNVTAVRLLFHYDVQEDTKTALGGALCRLPSLASLSLLNDNNDETIDLSAVLEGLNQSESVSVLQNFALCGVSVQSTYLKEFLDKQGALCHVAVHGNASVGRDSNFWSEGLAGLRTQSVRVLEVSGISAGSQAQCLCRPFPNLRVLRLLADDMSDEAFQHVAVLFSAAPHLQVVDLSGNKIGNGIRSLGKKLPERVEVLRLNDTGLDSEQVFLLANDVLPPLTNLQILSLCHYEYTETAGPGAWLAVLQWACTSSSLKQLDMKQCSMKNRTEGSTDSGITNAESLQEYPQSSIESLDISSNFFGECTVHYIRLFRYMPSLKNLDLSSICLTGSDAVELATVLPNCKQLLKMHLGDNNNVGILGMEALLKVLPELPRLEYLSLPDIYEEHTHFIQECLEHGSRYFIMTNFYELNQSQIRDVAEVVRQYHEA